MIYWCVYLSLICREIICRQTNYKNNNPRTCYQFVFVVLICVSAKRQFYHISRFDPKTFVRQQNNRMMCAMFSPLCYRVMVCVFTLAETEIDSYTDGMGSVIMLGSGYIGPSPRLTQISIGSVHILSASVSVLAV